MFPVKRNGTGDEMEGNIIAYCGSEVRAVSLAHFGNSWRMYYYY